MIERKNAEVLLCTCDQCGHSWTTLSEPKRCANCKTPAWNRDKSPAGRPKKPAIAKTAVSKRKRAKQPEAIPAIQSNYTDRGSDALNSASQPVPETPRSNQAPKSKEKKTRASVFERAPKVSKRKSGGPDECPHGMMMYQGITACERCKRGGR